MTPFIEQARRLHQYLLTHHWDGRGLAGPDSGVRVNYRLGRFVKSYLPIVPWRDSYYYLQAQGYWVHANWLLGDLTGEEACGEVAVRASDEMLARRRPGGSWEYPNREWVGRIATVEGTWAALGLLQSFRRTGQERFLAGALAWHDFLERDVGYEQAPGGIAVNYFAASHGPAVPNNSALVLRFLAELAALGVDLHGEREAGLLSFLRTVQRPTGELPYALPTSSGSGEERPHFQCFQYNAFQCLDLVAYHDITGDPAVLDLIAGLSAFVASGVGPDGQVFFDCRHRRRAVIYHAAAAGAALSRAARVSGGAVPPQAARAYRWVLAQQRPDGGLPFSRREYAVLRDRRSYPRNLAMILLHLLLAPPAGAAGREMLGSREEPTP
jgi:hypothetical protein